MYMKRSKSMLKLLMSLRLFKVLRKISPRAFQDFESFIIRRSLRARNAFKAEPALRPGMRDKVQSISEIITMTASKML